MEEKIYIYKKKSNYEFVLNDCYYFPQRCGIQESATEEKKTNELS